ncbi:ankyrin repeat domain-containing protein [Ottowia sp.]|uniref:ankyrin repeat domain-containing protein n=1 Tax=Ottowia sp. TaxID=1898956 RepID=UPI003A84D414
MKKTLALMLTALMAASVWGSEDTRMYLAAMKGDVAVMQKLIEAGADLNTPDQFGGPPLLNAAGTGEMEAVKFLLMAGADVNAKDKTGFTALHKATMGEAELDAVRLLLASHAQVDVLAHGVSPLMIAAQQGHLELLRTLLAAGANINLSNEYGATALMKAAEYGRLEGVKLLVDQGADMGRKDHRGQTALDIAQSVIVQKDGYPKVIAYLKEKQGRSTQGSIK